MSKITNLNHFSGKYHHLRYFDPFDVTFDGNLTQKNMSGNTMEVFLKFWIDVIFSGPSKWRKNVSDLQFFSEISPFATFGPI